jgi:hypothetical protein
MKTETQVTNMTITMLTSVYREIEKERSITGRLCEMKFLRQ